ncbi:MAG: phosphodiester glycosidase family protein [Bacteroidales bacterium]|nr:phosphodiester glycosidase family protein [Bacteroidales bacterium]
MKKVLTNILSLGLCVLLLAGCGAATKTDKVTNRYSAYAIGNHDRAGYEVKTGSAFVAPGLTLVTYHYSDLFGSPQDISIIEADPRKFRFNVLDHKSLKKTSEAASEAGAVAAINGTFYNMKQGGSVCYLQIDGQVADTTKGSNMKLRANGAVVIRNGRLSVEPWNQDKEKRFLANPDKNTSVMATMTLLVHDGYAVEILENKGFSDKRHPRSVIFEKDGKVCLMVIDGRSKGNAAGMTLDEIQRYLSIMGDGKGCKSAVNLDGGGSSTLWTAKDGIINHPSDNGKFDNKGERRVANSIIVIRK